MSKQKQNSVKKDDFSGPDYKIIIVGIALVIGMIGFVIGTNAFGNNSDAEAIREDYPEVAKNNVFVRTDVETILEILEGERDGIIVFAFPECPWCQGVLPLLNIAARNVGVDTIYYYNPKEIRSELAPEYQRIITHLGEFLSNDEEGNPRLFVPDIYVVVNGEILGQANEMAEDTDNHETYFTRERNRELIEIYKDLLRQFVR